MIISSKWLIIGWLIVLTIGIIGLGILSSKRSALLKNQIEKEIKEVREEMERLGDEIQHVKEIISEMRSSPINIPGWKDYRSEKYGYLIKYPVDATLKVYRKGDYVEILLPSSLGEKHVGIEVTSAPCQCPQFAATRYINGIKFCVTGPGAEGEGAMGSMYYVTHYLATKENVCIILITFLRTSTSIPYQDIRKEEEIFEQMISTFSIVP
jgi:hypothetical protein